MNLLIVESPNKARKIQSLLGRGWRVVASVGHVRDLPRKEMGVAPPAYRPEYEILEGKEEVIRRLTEPAKIADTIYLATDPDREGEAIAWHLKELLMLAGIGGQGPLRRVSFHEITGEAVRRAIAAPTSIDTALVAAQEARRVIDRLVGYQVSPRLGQGLSAGRVQSPALALVVDREQERRAHRKEPYYQVVAHLDTPAPWQAVWDHSPFLPKDARYWQDRRIAEVVAAARMLEIAGIERTRQAVAPPAPFTTSTLQQAASTRLKIPPDRTMALAQGLFEVGAITYHRTDNPNLSDEAVRAIQTTLGRSGHPVAVKVRRHAAKNGAQEAHEAIRPTDPAAESAGRDEDERALYALIRERALASVMPDAVYDVTVIEALADTEVPLGDRPRARFVARGRVLTAEPGWRAIAPGDDAKNVELPAGIQEGEVYPCRARVEDKETKPPLRYTEAALIKALEQRGIGRPSTYAAILTNIKRRNYVTVKERKLAPTGVGERIIGALRSAGLRFVGYDYTREMEARLDEIATGKASYRAVVAGVDQDLQADLARLPEPQPAPGPSGTPRGGGSLVDGARCRCGGTVRESPKAWQCTACGAIVWKEVARKRLTPRQGLTLLAGKGVHLKGMKSKAGKKFDARAVLDEDGKVKLIFEDQ